ncbi:MAG TPA: hypothetical protein VFA38_00515, partial [Nitrospirales bacterium]|nr:hypothetical protein [Nitrospirales bacterium]
MEAKVAPGPTDVQQGIATLEEVKRVSTIIHAAKDVDYIILDLRKDLTPLFGVEDVAIYIMDPERKDLYTKVHKVNTVEEHRLPLSEQSIVGFTAKYLRPLNVGDAYDKLELKRVHPLLNHDLARDQKVGFRTKQVLSYPILAENKFLLGVLCLLNKKTGEKFAKQDEQITVEIAKALSLAVTNIRKAVAKAATKFDYLLANKKITQADVDAALQESRKNASQDVESLLIEKYKVSKAELGKSLSQYYKCAYIPYADTTVLDPTLTKNVNLDLCKKNFWIPIKKDKGVVQVLVDDPNNLEKIQEIKRALGAQNIQFAVSLRRDIIMFIRVAKGEIAPAGGGVAGENISDIMGELLSE